jgi:hypothetical protein
MSEYGVNQEFARSGGVDPSAGNKITNNEIKKFTESKAFENAVNKASKILGEGQ